MLITTWTPSSQNSWRGPLIQRFLRHAGPRDERVMSELFEIVRTLARGLEQGSPDRKIWIAQHDRIRVYQAE